MDSGFVPPTIYNPITEPTAVGIAGSMEDFAVSLLQLLRHFKWYHATVLMEYSNGATLYDLIYGPLKGLLLSNKKYQDLRVERTQYVLRNEESYMAALKFASKRSRGTVFFLMKIHSVGIWFSAVLKNVSYILYPLYSVSDAGTDRRGAQSTGKQVYRYLNICMYNKRPSVVYVDTKNNQNRVVPLPGYFKLEGVA